MSRYTGDEKELIMCITRTHDCKAGDCKTCGWRKSKNIPAMSRLLTDKLWEEVNKKSGSDVMDIVVDLECRNINPKEVGEYIVKRCDIVAQETAQAIIAWADELCTDKTHSGGYWEGDGFNEQGKYKCGKFHFDKRKNCPECWQQFKESLK